MKQDKLAMKLAKEAKAAQSSKERTALLIALISSPAFQMIGTVAIAELLEKMELISPTWAGALEGGVIGMTGLLAIKETGILGALGVLTGGGIGALVSSPEVASMQSEFTSDVRKSYGSDLGGAIASVKSIFGWF